MFLDHYTIYPAANSVEVFVTFPSTDPFDPDGTVTARVVLDQAADLASNPAFTDQDVADAVVTKTASPQVTSIAVPIAILAEPPQAEPPQTLASPAPAITS